MMPLRIGSFFLLLEVRFDNVFCFILYSFAHAQSTTKLEYLNLSKNRFGEKAGVLLGSAIAENSSLRTLDLSWNCFRLSGAVALAKGLKVCRLHVDCI
jgi:Ran GTPase-activating protein (RanGAP) involved in mRNA processing and transport